MKEILLTKEKVALVDDEDYNRLSKSRWYYDECGNRARNSGLGHVPMTHVILWTDAEVDHIDGNGLNNQKLNLRECTHFQNSQNQRKTKKKTTSKYKGVHFSTHCHNRNWRAQIIFQDIFRQAIRVFLGSFPTEEEAARAYDEAARHYHGEFAALNFPKIGEQSCL